MESTLYNIKEPNLCININDPSASIFSMKTDRARDRANLQPPPTHLNQQLINDGFGSRQVRRRGGGAKVTGVVAKCAEMSNSGLVVIMELERDLAEIEKQRRGKEEQWSWREMMKNCMGMGEDKKGLVEVLECLEREAIMGEDKGRDPVDYNRRALIFDRSSRIFQALKQEDSHNFS